MQPNQPILKMFYSIARFVFSTLTLQSIWFDLIRLSARIKQYHQKDIVPPYRKLHVGCGYRHIHGWLNIDVTHSDCDTDLGSGRLIWRNEAFDAVVSQHVIEHLELREELIPLLKELHRVLKSDGEIWLSCPDIEKICRSYLEHGMADLLEDRKKRDPNYLLGNAPSKHLINDMFHQFGQHKNLFDFEILEWVLQETGFTNVERVNETDLITRFPEFPIRDDDTQAIYVRARAW